jgi:uncharacterized protein (DUF983 family)
MRKTEKYFNRLLVGISVISIFLFVVFMISITVWALFGLYLSEPVMIGVILLLLVISYLVGRYFDND